MRGYKARKIWSRLPKNILVIVCEGEKTEIQYFNGFKERDSGLKIVSLHGKCTDPRNIVEFAKKQISRWDLNFEDGDGL